MFGQENFEFVSFEKLFSEEVELPKETVPPIEEIQANCAKIGLRPPSR